MRWLCASKWLLLGVATTMIGCVGPIDHKRTVALVDPPRDRVLAAQETEPIKVSDVLQFRLPGDSTATLNGTCQVAPDGTIQLSGSTKVQVAGKTMEEARKAVREALAVSNGIAEAIELNRYDYYLVAVSADGIQDLRRVPLVGKVMVKDALAGAPKLSGKIIWVARPMPGQSLKNQVLAIDCEGISHGEGATNYALQAGDFLFIADEPAKGLGRVFGAVTSMFTPESPAAQTGGSIGQSKGRDYNRDPSGS